MTNIPAERAALAGQGLVMRYREQSGMVFDYTTDRACDVPASRLFLHLAVINPTTMDATQLVIERIGIDRFPATGYSYNAAVWTDGTLLEGQPLTRRGAHTVNDFQRVVCPNHGGPLTAPSWNLNVNARALVLPQNVQHPVTDAQVDSAARWAAAQKRAGYVTRDARWHGHRDVAAKSCPGDIGYARIPEIERLTEHYTVHGLTDESEPTQKEDDMDVRLVRTVDDGKIWLLAPGLTARWLDPNQFDALTAAGYGPVKDLNSLQKDRASALLHMAGAPAANAAVAPLLDDEAQVKAAVDAAKVDPAALAAELAPLLADQNVVVTIDDATLAAIGESVADEQARRLAE